MPFILDIKDPNLIQSNPMIKRLITSKLFAGAAALSLAASAQAASIAVLNGDFNIVPTTYYGTPAGWTQLSGADADAATHLRAATPGDATGFSPSGGWDGTRVLYSNGPVVASDPLTTLVANSIYTLTLQVGRRNGVSGVPVVQFFGGAAAIAPTTSGANPAPGSGLFETWTFTYDLGLPANVGFVGQSASIQLSKQGGSVQAQFDNVTLDVVPEASSGVLALGALGLMLRRKRN